MKKLGKISAVTYWDNDEEPVVSLFNNVEAAEAYFKHISAQHKGCCIDTCDVLSKYYDGEKWYGEGNACGYGRSGTWINIGENNCGNCDLCGSIGFAWMNFCPICGADMRGEKK